MSVIFRGGLTFGGDHSVPRWDQFIRDVCPDVEIGERLDSSLLKIMSGIISSYKFKEFIIDGIYTEKHTYPLIFELVLCDLKYYKKLEIKFKDTSYDEETFTLS